MAEQQQISVEKLWAHIQQQQQQQDLQQLRHQLQLVQAQAQTPAPAPTPEINTVVASTIRSVLQQAPKATTPELTVAPRHITIMMTCGDTSTPSWS